MRKIFLIVAVMIVLLSTAGIASARPWGHFGFYPRFYIGPPVPPPYYPYPYGGYYPPGYAGYRTWIPGHWESFETPHGWDRTWVPGHWAYPR
jgi:hypothetical protein